MGDGFDYGLIELTPYYVEMLKKNDIVALSEDVWKNPPDNMDVYYLLRISEQRVKFSSDSVKFGASFHPVTQKPFGEVSEAFSESNPLLFFGEVAVDDAVSSIRGMSGGPIFGFQQNDNGELRYWLIAIQSKWLPESHIIAASPTDLLGKYLESGMRT
jgi:hypothetical protein